ALAFRRVRSAAKRTSERSGVRLRLLIPELPGERAAAPVLRDRQRHALRVVVLPADVQAHDGVAVRARLHGARFLELEVPWACELADHQRETVQNALALTAAERVRLGLRLHGGPRGSGGSCARGGRASGQRKQHQQRSQSSSSPNWTPAREHSRLLLTVVTTRRYDPDCTPSRPCGLLPPSTTDAPRWHIYNPRCAAVAELADAMDSKSIVL